MAAAPKSASKPKDAGKRAGGPPQTGRDKTLALLRLVVEVVAIFAVIRTLFIAGYRIPSGSMEPTLMTGDWLFVTPLPYGPHIPFTGWNLPGFADPPRGRISIYQSPPQRWSPATPYFFRDDSIPVIVKRIVAVPGDTIYMRHGVFYVDGVEQKIPVTPPPGPIAPGETGAVFDWQHRYELKDSRFGPPPAVITHDDWGPLLVPPKSYFSLGDNRYNSIDARYYGFIPRKNFRGRPLIIYLSFDFDDLRMRWDRLFKILWNA